MNAIAKTLAKPIVAESSRQREADADWAIVQRVQAGDVAAFDQLILRYRERVFGLIYQMTSNREDAADLTQDAFIKAFQSIHRFAGQASFFTWLYRIALNGTPLTHLRRARPAVVFQPGETAREDGAAAEVLAQLTDPRGADRETFVKELQEKLNEALQKLSIKHRTVINLFRNQGLSHPKKSPRSCIARWGPCVPAFTTPSSCYRLSCRFICVPDQCPIPSNAPKSTSRTCCASSGRSVRRKTSGRNSSSNSAPNNCPPSWSNALGGRHGGPPLRDWCGIRPAWAWPHPSLWPWYPVRDDFHFRSGCHSNASSGGDPDRLPRRRHCLPSRPRPCSRQPTSRCAAVAVPPPAGSSGWAHSVSPKPSPGTPAASQLGLVAAPFSPFTGIRPTDYAYLGRPASIRSRCRAGTGHGGRDRSGRSRGSRGGHVRKSGPARYGFSSGPFSSAMVPAVVEAGGGDSDLRRLGPGRIALARSTSRVPRRWMLAGASNGCRLGFKF